MTKVERVGLAAAVFMALLALVFGLNQEPQQGVSVMGVTNLDSLTLRDNLIVGKATTLGSGGLAVTGNLSLSNGSLINTKGAVTVTDQLLVTSEIDGSNGLAVTGNVTVTGAGSFSSQLTASNGVAATGNVTVSKDVDVAGNILSTSGSVRINDNTLVTGTLGLSGDATLGAALAVQGNVSDQGGTFRINDNTLVTGTLGVSSQINAGNGVAVTGNISGTDLDLAGNAFSTSGSFRINDNVLITGTLDASSQINAANGVNATGNITSSGNVSVGTDLVMHGGNIWDDTNDVDFLDDVEISSVLTVDSQIIAANGIASTGGITASGVLTVSNWGLFYGLALMPATTQVVTANYGITPTSYSLMYVVDDGGQATGTIELDTTVSIVNGTYVGQLLMVLWKDADGATLTIQDGGNMQGPANADVVLGLNDSAMFLWDGTDWLCINVTDL